MNQLQLEPTYKFEKRPMQNRPGGFWIRFLANLIDILIITVIILPSNIVMVSIIGSEPSNALSISAMAFKTIFGWVFTGVFAGYFYSKKGATPGKLIFNLYVLDVETGSYISFWKGFFRDSIGKSVSGFIFCIGYIMAAFRKDKAALHDLMLNTRVLKKS